MLAFTTKNIQSSEELYFSVKLAWLKLCQYYAEVTSNTWLFLSSAHIHNPFQQLGSFQKWENVMDINHMDKTAYNTQYQDAVLKFVENTYCVC